MKRLSVLTVFLVLLSSGAAFALTAGHNSVGGLGAGYLAINENYTTSAGVQNITLNGIGVQSNFMTGLPLGFFGSLTMAYALNGAIAGTALDMSTYSTRLLFSMLFGVGYRLRLSQRAAVLIGAGGNALGALMLSPSTLNSLDLAYAGGFGAMVQASYAFTKQLSVFVSGSGAYDPFAIVSAVTVGYKQGFDYSAGAGLQLLY